MRHLALAVLILFVPALGAAQEWDCGGECPDDGTGTYTSSEGVRYEGQFYMGMRHGFARYYTPQGIAVMGYFQGGKMVEDGWAWFIGPDAVHIKPGNEDRYLRVDEDVASLARAALALNEAFFEPGRNDHWFTVDPVNGVWQMHQERGTNGVEITTWPIGRASIRFQAPRSLVLRCYERDPCLIEELGDEVEDWRKVTILRPRPDADEWDGVRRHLPEAMDAGLRLRAAADRRNAGDGSS